MKVLRIFILLQGLILLSLVRGPDASVTTTRDLVPTAVNNRKITSHRGIRYAQAAIGGNKLEAIVPEWVERFLDDARAGDSCPRPSVVRDFLTADCWLLCVSKRQSADGEERMDSNIVMASINYRLEALEFLEVGELEKGGDLDRVVNSQWALEYVLKYCENPMNPVDTKEMPVGGVMDYLLEDLWEQEKAPLDTPKMSTADGLEDIWLEGSTPLDDGEVLTVDRMGDWWVHKDIIVERDESVLNYSYYGRTLDELPCTPLIVEPNLEEEEMLLSRIATNEAAIWMLTLGAVALYVLAKMTMR